MKEREGERRGRGGEGRGQWGTEMQAFTQSTLGVEAGRFLGVRSWPALHRETLSQNKRWEKGIFHPITNVDLFFGCLNLPLY